MSITNSSHQTRALLGNSHYKQGGVPGWGKHGGPVVADVECQRQNGRPGFEAATFTDPPIFMVKINRHSWDRPRSKVGY